MHKITLALIIGLFISFGTQATACEMKAADATDQQNVYTQRMALMQERDALLLETVQLLKEVAKDKEAKTKAEALERRIQANIEKHGKMHAMMMGAGGMAGMEPRGGMMHKKDGCCTGKDKPCPMQDGAPSDKKAN